MRVALTGANRGIGLEFATQLVARGAQLEACARSLDIAHALTALARAHPDRVRLHPLDVASDKALEGFGRAINEAPLDLLINNAGVIGREGGIDQIDLGDVRQTFETNALGPLRVTLACLPALRRSTAKGGGKAVHLTSKMGSIGDNASGGYYAYRMSKAALNMMSKSLAIDLRGEVLSVVLHPGWVQTDMGGANATVTPEASVKGMLELIDRLQPGDSGKFFDYRGREIPW